VDHKLKLKIASAYLYSKLDKEIFLEQPEGFVTIGKENHVLPLLKGLYGLKQSAKLWNDQIKNTLLKTGFIQRKNDQGLNVFEYRDDVGYLIVYVDDIVLATNCVRVKTLLESALEKEYKVTNLGEVKSILGMNITIEENLLKISQPHYIETKVI
jgi:hypothetical protein